MENLKKHLEGQLWALEQLREAKAAEFDAARDAALEKVDRDIEKTEIQLAAEMEIKPAQLRKQRREAAKAAAAPVSA